MRSLYTTLPLLSWALLSAASPAPIPQGGLTESIQNLVEGILNGLIPGQSDEILPKPSFCPDAIDPCCVWYDVSAELTSLFKEANGNCNDLARAAVRLGFHDAGSWSQSSTHGGADGSLIMNFGEENRPENNGLQNIRNVLRTVQAKYNVGYADLVQYAHNHATVTCPRGPRIITFIGRQDATQAAPTGLLPDTNSSPASLIQLFADKGFTAADLAALVGAHTSAKQRFHNPAKANFPLDTTPGVWDVEFYNETLQNPSDPSIVVLPSDKALSTHAQTSGAWNGFVGNQIAWNIAYARTWIRMSLLGVDNFLDLRLCTRTLPLANPFG